MVFERRYRKLNLATVALGLMLPAVAAAQSDTDGELEATPAWATCERYRSLLDGDDSAAVPTEQLRILPFAGGATIDIDAEAIASVLGPVVETPSGSVPVGGSEVIVVDSQRILALVALRSELQVVALVANGIGADWEAGDSVAGIELLELERTVSGYRPVGWDGEPAFSPLINLPDSLVAGWNAATAEDRDWELSRVGNQIVLLHYRVHYCPGGCSEYCGWLSRALEVRSDNGGGLQLIGEVPVEAAANGSNVLEGGVFYFETEQVDLDGDGLPDQRIRPLWSSRHDTCDEQDVRPADDDAAVDRDVTTSPLVVHRRLADGRLAWLETDLTDLLVPLYTRALEHWRAHQTDQSLADLRELVLGLEMLLGRPRPGRDAYSLQYLIFEAPESLDSTTRMREAPWLASRARMLEMLVGVASLAIVIEAEGETSELHARLRALGDFGFCGGDGVFELASPVELQWR